MEEGICIAQQRAAAEGLGVLARLGNDIYAARLVDLHCYCDHIIIAFINMLGELS